MVVRVSNLIRAYITFPFFASILCVVCPPVYRVFQEMLYGFSTGFGSPQVSVADILARAVPTLHSPSHKPKSSNFLQVRFSMN